MSRSNQLMGRLNGQCGLKQDCAAQDQQCGVYIEKQRAPILILNKLFMYINTLWVNIAIDHKENFMLI